MRVNEESDVKEEPHGHHYQIVETNIEIEKYEEPILFTSQTEEKITQNQTRINLKKPDHCREFDKIFSRNNYLTEHLGTHTREKPYQCNTREKAFSSKNFVTKHIRIKEEFDVKEEPNDHHCEKIEIKYEIEKYEEPILFTSQLEENFTQNQMGINLKKPVQCSDHDHKSILLMECIKENICQVTRCNMSSSASQHIDDGIMPGTHTKERCLLCSYCDKFFFHDKQLLIHNQSHLKVVLPKLNIQPVAANDMRFQRLEKISQCTQCSKVFSNSKQLIIHLKSHLKVLVTKLDIQPVSEQSLATSYYCSQCAKAFSKRINLVIHLQTHPDNKSNTCNHRGIVYSHTRFIHSSKKHILENAYQCRQCEKNISRNCTHINHRFNNTVDKYINHHFNNTVDKYCTTKSHYNCRYPFSCDLCNKEFKQKHHLKRHLRTHTGEKPFHCSHCNKDYSRVEHLKRHLRTLTGEKPFHCSHCNKEYSRVEHLKNHLRTHTAAGRKILH